MPSPADLPPPLRALLDEHRHAERLLVLLEEQAGRLARGHVNCADLDLARSIMSYMTRYPDRYHHAREDLILERVQARDPARRAAVARLRRDHEQIGASGAALLERLSATRAPRLRTRRVALAHELNAYAEALRQHMRQEEASLLAPAQELLDARDWRAIDRAIAPMVDPVFGTHKPEEFVALFAAYVERIVPVARGSVPLGLFDWMAEQLEVGMHTLRRPFAAPYRALVRLRRPGAPGPGPNNGHDFVRFDAQVHRPRRSAAISWQATLTNLFLRSTIKQAMARVDTRSAAELKRFLATRPPPRLDAAVEELVTDTFQGHWIQPLQRRSRRTILYFPGGGFFFPATSSHYTLLARLTRRCGARALMVHYRLAPEHPFPAGLDDAVAAYRHLLDSGVAAQDIVIAGDSAGGGLTLSLLLALRQQGLPLPAGAALLSALTDLSFSTPSRRYNRWRDPMLPVHRRMEGFSLYSGDTADTDPLLSPVYGDFAGFPPLLAQVGSTEILLDDTLRVARKARTQGVDVEVEVWEGMPHDWQILSFIPESGQALDSLAAFFKRCWSTAAVPQRKATGTRARPRRAAA